MRYPEQTSALLNFLQNTFGTIVGPSLHTPGKRKQSSASNIGSPETLEVRQLLTNVGGGYLDHGLDGIYYSDSSFTTPAFSRKDVRLEFDWGTYSKPGGSISAEYSDVTTDHYSIRWTGQVMPRFSETYTFSGVADDTVLLEIKLATDSTWTTVVNQTSTQASFSGTFAMVSGEAYDIRVSYTEQTGTAAIQLRWSSPSTPIETIDTITQSGINNPDGPQSFVDYIKGALRNNWDGDGLPLPSVDADGWPMAASFGYYFQQSQQAGLNIDPLMLGTIQFQFNGKADVRLRGNFAEATLNWSYNAGTNLTTGSFVTTDQGLATSKIGFDNATRDGEVGGPAGITNLKLFAPTYPNSPTNYDVTSVFTTHMKDAMKHFEVIRFQMVASQEREWSDRTTPGYFNQSQGTKSEPFYDYPYSDISNNGWAWEYKIMLANETGRDLMLSVPPLATGRTIADTSSYIVKLANLIRYGSDGVEPYTSEQANPVYPPLNSNLRVYLELGNELWNTSGVFNNNYSNMRLLAEDVIAADGEDADAIAYDGSTDISVLRKRIAMLRTIQISNIFRGVFGDSAMPMTGEDPRIRPVYEWHNGNKNNTAQIPLTWADNYFNKADPASTYSGNATPVRYFLYGAGGAAYYGASNSHGVTDLLANPFFGFTTVADGYTENPGGTGWTFTGTAGIARDAGAGDDIPTPYDGAQVGYLKDQSSMTASFVVPLNQTSDFYAVSFKAHNRLHTDATTIDKQNIRVYLDYGTENEVDITAKTYSQLSGYTPLAISQISPWKSRVVKWADSQYYYTKSFNLVAGSTHTVTIRGMGDITGSALTDQTAFIGSVRVTSVDAIFASEIPAGGEATGQAPFSDIIEQMRISSDWAKAFGLEHVAYESGWSMGGDDGGSYIQLKAKYGDLRTATAQRVFMDFYHQMGGDLDVFGTYAQWSRWYESYAEQGLLDVAQYPIIVGMDGVANTLKTEATSGTAIPSVLDTTSITLSYQVDTTTLAIKETAGWLTWNVIAPRTGSYVITAQTASSSSFLLLVDDTVIATGSATTMATGTVQLVKGLNVLKVRSTSGALSVSTVTVVGENAPASPTIAIFTEDSGNVSLTWGAVAGATGYVVRYGTSSSQLNQRVDVGTSLQQTISGFPYGTVVYFAVGAYNSNGESLPSTIRAVNILRNGIVGTLAQWEFTGQITRGTEVPTTIVPKTTVGQVNVSAMSRGAGLIPAPGTTTQNFPNRFLSKSSVGTSYGATIAAAISRNEYVEFTVTPVIGKQITITEINFQAWFQVTTGVSVGLQYSTDGSTFTTIEASGVPNSEAGYTINLTDVAELRSVQSTVRFRIIQAGAGDQYKTFGIGNGTGSPDLVLRGKSEHLPLTINGPTGMAPLQRPSISWTPVGGATGYDVWINNVSTNQNPYWVTSSSTNNLTPSFDLGIGVFDVWVRAFHSDGTRDAWSAKYRFQINTPPTVIPIDSLQSTSQPTIRWNPLPGAVKYDVWIDNYSAGISQSLRNQNVTGTSWTQSSGMAMGVYRVWVRGVAQDGTASSWSPVMQFSVVPAPTITGGNLPTFNRTPTFAWNAVSGAVSYEVIVRSSTTGVTVYYPTNISGTSWTPPVNLPDGPYRWWAIAVGANSVRGLWTAAIDMYVGGRPSVLSPAGTVNKAMPTINWQAVDGAVRYELWVNTDPGVRVIHDITLTGTSYTPSASLANGGYRVWVRAVSSSGEFSPWSSAVSFTVSAMNSPESNSLQSGEFLFTRLKNEKLKLLSTQFPRTQKPSAIESPMPLNEQRTVHGNQESGILVKGSASDFIPSGEHATITSQSDLAKLWEHDEDMLAELNTSDRAPQTL